MSQSISILVALEGADEGLKRALTSAERSLGALAAVLAHLRPALDDGALLRECVAGYQFHGGMDLEAQMGVGDALDLVREPENPHDPLAVAVRWRGERIGFVPRRVNADIAHRLDAEDRLVCHLTRFDENADTWERWSSPSARSQRNEDRHNRPTDSPHNQVPAAAPAPSGWAQAALLDQVGQLPVGGGAAGSGQAQVLAGVDTALESAGTGIQQAGGPKELALSQPGTGQAAAPAGRPPSGTGANRVAARSRREAFAPPFRSIS